MSDAIVYDADEPKEDNSFTSETEHQAGLPIDEAFHSPAAESGCICTLSSSADDSSSRIGTNKNLTPYFDARTDDSSSRIGTNKSLQQYFDAVESDDGYYDYQYEYDHNYNYNYNYDNKCDDKCDDNIDDKCDDNDDDNDDDDNEGNKPVVGSCAVELPSNIASVQVLLQTQFMQPLQARIELELRMTTESGSPGYRVVKRTIVEVYSEDGMDRPFFAVLEAPRKAAPLQRSTFPREYGDDENENKNDHDENKNKNKNDDRQHQQQRRGWFGGSKGSSYCTSMRVVNLSTTEFPLFATVEPHAVDPSRGDDDDDVDTEDDDDVEPAGEASRRDNDYDNDNDVQEYQEDSQEWTHFGGGSNYDMISNSTILDAEIL